LENGILSLRSVLEAEKGLECCLVVIVDCCWHMIFKEKGKNTSNLKRKLENKLFLLLEKVEHNS